MKHNFIVLILLILTINNLFSAAASYYELPAPKIRTLSHNFEDQILLEKLAQFLAPSYYARSYTEERTQLFKYINGLPKSRVEKLNDLSRQTAPFGYKAEREIISDISLSPFFDETIIEKNETLYLSNCSGNITPVNVNTTASQPFTSFVSTKLLSEQYRRIYEAKIQLIAHDGQKYIMCIAGDEKQGLLICDQWIDNQYIPLSCPDINRPYRIFIQKSDNYIWSLVGNYPTQMFDYGLDNAPKYVEVVNTMTHFVKHIPIFPQENPVTSAELCNYSHMYSIDKESTARITGRQCHFVGFHKPSGQWHYRSYLSQAHEQMYERAIGVQTARGCVLELQRKSDSPKYKIGPSKLILASPTEELLLYDFNRNEKMQSDTLQTFPNNPTKIVYKTITYHGNTADDFSSQINIKDLESNTSNTIPLKNKYVWDIKALENGSILIKNSGKDLNFSIIEPKTVEYVLSSQ